jgi:glycosyltransferase involved in cell wall biosynthesis
LLLSVVVPVFNEAPTLLEILRRLVHVDLPKQIILVDDCSTDGSRELLQQLSQEGLSTIPDAQPNNRNVLRVLFQSFNQGKGAALRRGFSEATGDVVVVQDADLEYDPQDLVRLTQPIRDGIADVVYGTRFSGSPRRVLYFWHAVVNRALTTASNLSTGLNLTDMETCYKAFRREVLQGLHLQENRFGFEPEVTAKVAKGRFRIYEVPVSYYGRTYQEGKKIGWKDGVRALYVIAKYALPVG